MELPLTMESPECSISTLRSLATQHDRVSYITSISYSYESLAVVRLLEAGMSEHLLSPSDSLSLVTVFLARVADCNSEKEVMKLLRILQYLCATCGTNSVGQVESFVLVLQRILREAKTYYVRLALNPLLLVHSLIWIGHFLRVRQCICSRVCRYRYTRADQQRGDGQ